jgi:hypothetical protein
MFQASPFSPFLTEIHYHIHILYCGDDTVKLNDKCIIGENPEDF